MRDEPFNPKCASAGIDLPREAVGVANTSDFAARSRPRASKGKKLDRLTLAGLKKTQVDKLKFEWLKQRFDLTDFMILWSDGRVWQQSNQDREAWLNNDADHFKPKRINATDVCLATNGHFKLSLRPKRPKPGEQQHTIVRLDADQHDGQTDAEAILRAAAAELPGQWYIEESSTGTGRGFSAYSECAVGRASKPETNASIERLGRTLVAWAKRRGFAATIEAFGQHTIATPRRFETLPATPDDPSFERLADFIMGKPCPPGDSVISYRKMIVARPPGVRVPNASTIDAFDELRRAHTDLEALTSWCREQRDMQPVPDDDDVFHVAEHVANRSRPRGPQASTGREHRHIARIGAKKRDRGRAAGIAMREIIGNRTSCTDNEMQRIVERANVLIHMNGLNGGERDAKRDAAIRKHARSMMREKTAGRGASSEAGPNWFTLVGEGSDLVATHHKVTRLVSARKHRQANAQLRVYRQTVSLEHIALVALFDLKAILSNDNGAAPFISVIGFCHHFGVKLSWSQIRVAREVAASIGLTPVVDHTFDRGRSQRRAVGPAALNIPFIAVALKDSPAAVGRSLPISLKRQSRQSRERTTRIQNARARALNPAPCGGREARDRHTHSVKGLSYVARPRAEGGGRTFLPQSIRFLPSGSPISAPKREFW